MNCSDSNSEIPKKVETPNNKEAIGERPTSKNEDRPSYDDFVHFVKDPTYFGVCTHQDFMIMAQDLRNFFLKTLSKRPYGEEEFYELLSQEAPHLNSALEYFYEQVENEGEYESSCKKTLADIVEGVEVRIRGGDIFFGLTSKLDSV